MSEKLNYWIITGFRTIHNRIGRYIWRKPKIKSIDDTLDYIIENHCSVSRFGDGEFALIQGNYNGFQEANEELGRRLAEILKTEVENHIVCLPDVFDSLRLYRKSSIIFNRGMLDKERQAWLKLLDPDRTYYNAFFTRCYMMFRDKSKCEGWFSKNKAIWDGRDVLLIEGRYSRLGVGNDLFSNTHSINRLLAPAKNAFVNYREILELAKIHGTGKLILIALGMTATVLAYDLAKIGLWAIDIGHIDIEYEWFLHGADNKEAIDGKYVNEVKDGKIESECTDPVYLSQIIAEIG